MLSRSFLTTYIDFSSGIDNHDVRSRLVKTLSRRLHITWALANLYIDQSSTALVDTKAHLPNTRSYGPGNGSGQVYGFTTRPSFAPSWPSCFNTLEVSPSVTQFSAAEPMFFRLAAY